MILYNDDKNTFEYVVGVVMRVIRITAEEATKLVKEAHETGRSIIFCGSFEVAEFKHDQIKSCGPDPTMKAYGAEAVQTSVEEG